MRVLAVCVALAALSACGKKDDGVMADAKRPAAPVLVAKVIEQDAAVDLKLIGNVEAYQTVTMRSRVGGELVAIKFQEGDFVAQGDLLFEIDPRPFQGAVRRAEAALARDTAMLKQFEANLARDLAQEAYPKAQVTRYQKLFAEGVIAREQVEEMQARADSQAEIIKASRAAIDSARETIRADQVALEGARLELSFCSIRAPVTGRTGNLAVRRGAVVKAIDADLVTIHQVQPVYVTFAVPESALPEVKKRMAAGSLPVIATPTDGGPVETGSLTFIDNAVDVTTGTIKLKGTFTNPARRLWPGQFINVSIRLRSIPNAKTVPNAAVQLSQQGPFVYVVKADNTAEMRPVKPGTRLELATVIEQGLSTGETVVIDGHLRLAPGSLVKVMAK